MSVEKAAGAVEKLLTGKDRGQVIEKNTNCSGCCFDAADRDICNSSGTYSHH